MRGATSDRKTLPLFSRIPIPAAPVGKEPIEGSREERGGNGGVQLSWKLSTGCYFLTSTHVGDETRALKLQRYLILTSNDFHSRDQSASATDLVMRIQAASEIAEISTGRYTFHQHLFI